MHESESEVAQSCLTLSDPMDCSPPGSSIHGISRQQYWSGVPLSSPMNVLLGMKSETSDNLRQDCYFLDYFDYVIWELKLQ